MFLYKIAQSHTCQKWLAIESEWGRLQKADLYFEMLLFSEKGHKVTLMPFPFKSDHRDKQETHYDFFTL